jgi:agmatinase
MTSTFNPDSIGVPNGNMWALPHVDYPAVAIIGVPWNVTCSQGDNTIYGPAAVLAASPLIALDTPAFWEKGVRYFGDIDGSLQRESEGVRHSARKVIERLGKGQSAQMSDIDFVRAQCQSMCEFVQRQTYRHIDVGSKVLLLGGDHSTPFGAIMATHNRKKIDTILHIDAHADMYEAYEGFAYSHASIMYNVRQMLPNVRMVHLGLRDVATCEWDLLGGKPITEMSTALLSPAAKHTVFTGNMLGRARVENNTRLLLRDVCTALEGNVYITYDVDGLEQAWFPNTGTPVMGGLTLAEHQYLLGMLERKIDDKEISLVGADLVEVAPASSDPDTWESDWNANVGMRVLYDITKLLLR